MELGGGDCAGDDSHLQFLYGHGAISDRLMHNISKTCSSAPGSQACAKLQAEADSMADGLNGYDFYRDCYAHDATASRLDFGALRSLGAARSNELIKLVQGPRQPHPAVAQELALRAGSGTGMNVPCIDSDGGNKWLNNPAVRQALHVDTSPNQWSICSLEINQFWDRSEYPDGMAPLYQEMMGALKIMVYNGDVDPACDYVSNQRCMDSLGAPVDEAWRAWHYNDPHQYDPAHAESGGPQVGGWVTKFKPAGAYPMYFLTIKGAGHMSPQWKPLATITWLTRFLNGSTI